MLRGASDDRVRLHCALGSGEQDERGLLDFVQNNAPSGTSKPLSLHGGPNTTNTPRRRRYGEMENFCSRVLSSCGVLGGVRWLDVGSYGPIRCARANWHEPGGGL